MELGKWNILRIDRIKDVGAYLTDGKGLNVNPEVMDVLLPVRQIPEGLEIGDNVEVFLYRDSEDRVIATTHEPLITLGEIKKLKVKSVGDIGAFLDWGLSRDLFLPFKEQTVKVQQEKSYLVKLYVDKTGRLAASMRISSDLHPNDTLQKGDHVKGVVYNVKKDFGVFVALENEEQEYYYSGLIHSNEVFENLYVGDEVVCRVVKAREDGKIDLAMRDEIPKQMEKDSEMVLDIIMSYGGTLPFNDKADASLIKKEFGISKNAFKRAVGRLLKEGKVEITEKNIVVK
ncbi:MAG TPA: RNA-binding protein [Lachnospiraceae bacterium]|nr:S1 RNA-binding domain-containing protein [Eubacterium sp.]HBZ03481.1 RNA-binding protein [Lachnospiraceae bacterium]